MSPAVRPLAALFGCVWAIVAVGGGVYKWVDAEGNTHYGERPPADRPVAEVRLTPPPSLLQQEQARSDLERARAREEQDREAQRRESRMREERAAGAKQQEGYCREQRSALEALTSLPMRRIGIQDPDGQVRRVTEEEWQEKIRRARENVEKFCR